MRANLVERVRLNEALREMWEVPLTLVSAPAGFGKTSAALAAVQGANAAVAWLSLDEQDDDPTLFWRYLVTSLREATGIGQELASALASPQPPPLPAVLGDLINALDDVSGEVLMCVDDYHLIHDASIHEGVRYLLEHAPTNLHLLLLTRADPPLPLHRLRARGQLLELRADDLRFTPHEATALLEQTVAHPLAKETVAGLLESTEGWVTGLQLAALALQGPSSHAPGSTGRQLTEQLSKSNAFVLEYLAEEVLAQQRAELQTFLLETSILDKLSASLCDTVTERQDSQTLLDELSTRGLFLTPVNLPDVTGLERQWFRYHRLFAKLLEGRLRSQTPERAPLLLQRAAAWHEAQGDHETALSYAFAAGDEARAARLLDELAYPLVMQGRARTVETWLQRLPDAWRARSVRASLAFAWALLLRGRYPDLAVHLHEFITYHPKLEPALQAELHALQATLADTQGDAAAATHHAREAMRLAPSEHRFTQAAAHMALAGAQREQGQVAAAIDSYEHALPLCRAARLPVPEGLARAHLGFLYTLRGQLRKAASVTRALAETAHHPAAAAAQLARCQVLLEWNHLSEVARALPEALALAHQGGHHATLVQAHLVTSRLCRAQGDFAGAHQALEEAATRVERGAPVWLRSVVLAERVKLFLAEGDTQAAEKQLEHTPVEPGGHLGGLLALARARLLLHTRTPEALNAALEHLQQVDNAASHHRLDGQRLEALVLQALTQAAQDELLNAQTTLRRALTLAEPEGYVRLFIEAGPECASLLARLGTPYAKQLLTVFPSEVQTKLA